MEELIKIRHVRRVASRTLSAAPRGLSTRAGPAVAAAVLAALAALAAARPAAGQEHVWQEGKWVPAVKPAEGTPAGELALIRRHIEAKEHQKAVDLARRFLTKYAGNPAREEAMLLAGQAELDAERYYQAYEWFERQLSEYPNGQFVERALAREMDVAEAFLAGRPRIVGKVLRLPARDEGLSILNRIADHAPGTVIAEKALLRVGEHRFSRGEFAESADAYDHYLQLFPKSANAPHAMLQAARAMYASYKGPAFDDTPMVEAEQRFRTLAEQYPATAQKARVDEILRQIGEVRAQKLYDTARFYDRTGRRDAARFYYRQLVNEYPQTRWTAEARAALGGGGGPAPGPRDAVPAAPAAAAGPDAPAAAQKGGKPLDGDKAQRPAAAVEIRTARAIAPAPATARAGSPQTAPASRPAETPQDRAKPAPDRRPTSLPGPIDLEKLVPSQPKGGQ